MDASTIEAVVAFGVGIAAAGGLGYVVGIARGKALTARAVLEERQRWMKASAEVTSELGDILTQRRKRFE